MSQPKLYITLQFCPLDLKPYSLDCLLDSGAQLNLARHLVIPPYITAEYMNSSIYKHKILLVILIKI